MKSLGLFTTDVELRSFADQWRKRFNLHIGLITYHPDFHLHVLLDTETLDTLWNPLSGAGGEFRELWLSAHVFDTSASMDTEVRAKNPNVFLFRLPKLEASVIPETTAGTVAVDVTQQEIWKKLASDLKKRTTSGMWIVDRAARNKSFYRDLRYTIGAATLVNQGWRLKSFEGFEITIDEPSF